MICFCCKKLFDDLYIYIRHLKLQHGLNTNSNYKCLENNCLQSFQNLSSFKKHLKRKHLNEKYIEGNNLDQSANTVDNNVSHAQKKAINTNSSENSFYENFEAVAFPNNNLLHSEKAYDFDVNLCLHSVKKAAATFTLSLHNNNNFTKKDVFMIQNNVKEYILESVLEATKEIFKQKLSSVPGYNDVVEVLDNFKDPFDICSSDYKLNSWLQQNDLIDDVKLFTIHNEVVSTTDKGKSLYDEKSVKGVLLPLRFQMKKVFEKDDNLQKHLAVVENLDKETSLVSNFVKSELWKEKVRSFNKDDIVVPYYLYIDDLEINNPLSSHSTSQAISAFYYSFPVLLDHSKLDNIFLAAVIKATDLKTFGNEKCLNTIIDEISFMEREGITINSTAGSFKVYFVLGLILGDNLGLNSILGFSKSFSSNYYCRFCKMHKRDCQSSCKENKTLLRTLESYENDVRLINPSESGVYQDSLFNNIETFHVTTNFSVDVMHDIFEGICHYNLTNVILYFIETVNLFSLDQLNFRKQNFDYGRTEIGNLSPPIRMEHLQKKHLKMTAREMMCFVHFFPLIVGDLIPENNEVWSFFLNFLQIIDLLLSHIISPQEINLLEQLIQRHLHMYTVLFQDTLKPKHHLLLHYPTVMRKSGPPRNYWCFRFEAKHHEIKLYAHATNSRRNIPLTLAKKCQLKFSNYILSNSNQQYSGLNGTEIQVAHKTFICNRLNVSCADFACYKDVNYKGVIYKVDDYLSYFADGLSLFKILSFICAKAKMFVFSEIIKNVYYNAHYEAYEITSDLSNSNNQNVLTVDNIESFTGPPVHVCRLSNGKKAIRLKEYF